MRVESVAWLLVAGCGRLGFETTTDGDPGGGEGSGADEDAPRDTASDASEVVVTFGEHPTAMVTGVTRDTYLSLDAGATINFGGADDVRMELDNAETGLIAFTLTAIPTTATVTSAALRFEIETAAAGSTIEVRTVLEDWVEGTGDGTAGIASYSVRLAAIPWTNAGANPPTSAGEIVAIFSGGTLGPIDVILPAALVQGWVTNPASNAGVVMSSDSNDTVRVVSSEGSANLRPVLTVTYQ